MKPETIQILGTLQVLIEPSLYFYLPYHEDGGKGVPFVWEVAEKGEFNLLNLSREKGWLRLTDVAPVLKSWQDLEYLKSFPDFSLDSSQKALRDTKFLELQQILETDLHNCEAFILPYEGWSNSPGIIIGQTPDQDWICIAPTVYIPSEIPNDVIARSPLPTPKPSQPLPEQTIGSLLKIQAIILELGSIQLNGDFGGGYYYEYTHQLVCAAAHTKELAIFTALQASGTLEIHQFDRLFSERDQEDLSYDRLNQFLKQNLSPLMVYRFSFWTDENIYIIAPYESEDWLGLYLNSVFVYNP
ncbi:hypothetical protein C7H19_06500 [Aphanothece hegewaldii CCALA 016]|uniref:Uncharacterized protein n=1 Tax=Aphanothece hegewaldii CCALA 016 TaxID=2107694 RepID=A0A2T1M0B5_9CHRO|nr:hypothetical protein [Aphanothece hegewaldii]PSF38116.1 hypothetical protein C7H19_06500 [Aphanothece hegewaldii CCALA 016]